MCDAAFNVEIMNLEMRYLKWFYLSIFGIFSNKIIHTLKIFCLCESV